MLKKEKCMTVSGRSIIGDKEVCGYNATIESENPANMTFSSYTINKELYKENRTECRADEAAFEDYCYELQDKMYAELSEKTEA